MQWILVTGASRGIGASVAVELASQGFNLILWSRSGNDLEEVAVKCRAFGVQIKTAIADISCPNQVSFAAEESLSEIPKLKGCVINAGGATFGSLDDYTVDEWKAVIATNLDGAFYTLKKSLPLLERDVSSQIVFMGSQSAIYGFETQAGYCASKAGLNGLIEVVRREKRSRGIRVTNMVLSGVDTYFRGKVPGDRKGALEMDNVSQVIGFLFKLPESVEIRELQMSSMNTSFGPYPEKTNL